MDGSAQAETKQSRRWRLPEALPSLGPVGMRIYVALWSALLVAAILAPPLNVYLQHEYRAAPTWSAIGLRLEYGGQRLVIDRVQTSRARAAGLSEGDEILAVNGVRATPGPGSVGSMGNLLLGPEGSIERLSVRRTGQPPREVILRRVTSDIEARFNAAGISASFWDRSLGAASLLTSLLLIVAALLLFARRRQPVPALLSIGLLILPSSSFSGYVGLALGLEHLVRLINVIAWGGVALAILTMPDGRFTPRVSLAVGVGILLSSALIGLGLVNQTVGNLIFASQLAACIIVLALRYRRVTSGIERQQLRWAFFGFTVGTMLIVVGSVEQDWIPALHHYDPSWDIWSILAGAALATVGVGAWTFGLIVSLLKYRLYDADAVIGRSATFGVLTVALLGIFAGSEKIIEVLGEEYFGDGLGALAGGLGAAVAAVMLVPLHHRVNRWAERRFQKGLHNMRVRLPLLVGDLRETAGLERIGAAVMDAVLQGVRASRAALLVGEKVESARGIDGGEVEAWRSSWKPSARDGLDCDRRDKVFPMRVALDADGHGRVGWLLLGPRPDGSFFGKDERAALAEVADPIARAVEVAREREVERADRGNAISALQRELADLREEMFRLFRAPRLPAAE